MNHFGSRPQKVSAEPNPINKLCDLAPYTVLINLQKWDFQAAFHILQNSDWNGKTWQNMSSNNLNLILTSGSVSTIEIIQKSLWALRFKNGILHQPHLTLMSNSPHSSGFLNIVYFATSDSKQTLISGYTEGATSFNELLLSGTEVTLKLCDKTVSIQHSSRVAWNKLWLQWRSGSQTTRWFWKLGKQSGHFETPATFDVDSGLTIGGRQGSESYFHGSILALDLYKKVDNNLCIPEKLFKLINQAGLDD